MSYSVSSCRIPSGRGVEVRLRPHRVSFRARLEDDPVDGSVRGAPAATRVGERR